MKRYLIIAIICICAAVSASAQQDLQINQIFGGKYAGDPSVTETMMSGNQKFLRYNHLNNFATFKGDAKTYAKIIQPLVLADGNQAIGRNIKYKDGLLQYAFFMLKPITAERHRINRYIYYVYNSKATTPTVMVIYFDGQLSRNQADALVNKLSK